MPEMAKETISKKTKTERKTKKNVCLLVISIMLSKLTKNRRLGKKRLFEKCSTLWFQMKIEKEKKKKISNETHKMTNLSVLDKLSKLFSISKFLKWHSTRHARKTIFTTDTPESECVPVPK